MVVLGGRRKPPVFVVEMMAKHGFTNDFYGGLSFKHGFGTVSASIDVTPLVLKHGWLGTFPFLLGNSSRIFSIRFPTAMSIGVVFLGFSSVLSAPNRKIGVQWGVFPPHTWHLAVSIPGGRSKSSGMMKNRGFFHGEDDAYKGE